MPTFFDLALDVLERRQRLMPDERRLEQVLSRRYGITSSQLALLLSVELESKSVSQVAADMGVIPGNVTGIADRLVDCSLITREFAPDDRRVTYLRITALGTELLERIRVELSIVPAEEAGSVDVG